MYATRVDVVAIVQVAVRQLVTAALVNSIPVCVDVLASNLVGVYTAINRSTTYAS
jgi:hypothetical protein